MLNLGVSTGGLMKGCGKDVVLDNKVSTNGTHKHMKGAYFVHGIVQTRKYGISSNTKCQIEPKGCNREAH